MTANQVDRIDGLVGSIAVKAPVRVATTAAITLSGAQTIDGVSLTADASPRERVLVKDQASGIDNGIYDVNSGAWTRSPDFDGSRDVVDGTRIWVNEGTVPFSRSYYLSGTNPVTIGTDSLTFVAIFVDFTGSTLSAKPDYSETDQGVTGDGSTIKAAVDSIGASQGTILLRHNSGDATTTYTLNTSETIPSNITLERENGVIIDGAGTLTINGPFNSGLSQAFGSSITVAFAGGTIDGARIEWWQDNTTPGTTDMTVAFQAALVASSTVLLEEDTYLITDTLVILTGQTIKGKDRYTITELQGGVSQDALTCILFAPTSEKDLFDITTLGGFYYVTKVYIGGFYVKGNTTGGVTYSKYGINSKAAQSTFENLGFERFQAGIYCSYTMSNEYRNVYLSNMSVACIYTGTSDINTTDTFINTIMRESPWGAILRKAYSFRFISCLWESLTVGGVNHYKDSAGLSVISGYCENVPSGAGGADYGMFYINKDGTTTSWGNVAIIGGCYYGITTAPPGVGSFLDVGETTGRSHVQLSNLHFMNYNRGIRADASDTMVGTIGLSNVSHRGVSGDLYTNEVKDNVAVIYGILPGTNSTDPAPMVKADGGYFNNLSLLDVDNKGSAGLRGYSSAALADDDEIEITSLAAGAAEMYLVTMNDGAGVFEAGIWAADFVGAGTTVAKVAGTTNTAATDSDTDLCVYASTTSVMVKNRLGAACYVTILRIN